MPRRLFCLVLRSLLTPNCHIEARSRARDTSMTKRSTRRAVPLAIACAWLALAGFTDASPAWAAPAAAPASAPAVPGVPAGSAATVYTVKPGQSLADIAAFVTQSHDKTVLGRAARAIFDANPSAFMRGDPSLLKLGATLNVPPLDATGAVAKAEPAAPAASAAAGASNGTPAASPSAAASQAAAAAPKASAAQAAKPGPGQGSPAASPAPASAAAGGTANAKAAPAPAAPAAPNTPATTAPHSQPSAPVGASGGHAWAGAIQPAPAAPASAVEQSGASEAGASAALGAVQPSAPASAAATSASEAATASAAASNQATSAAAAAGASTGAANAPRAAKPAPASAAAASATPASHPKVSSLQQLLTLKNRVLMELQRHGFGSNSANRTGAGGANTPAGPAGFSARPAASGAASTPAPGQSRAAAAANQRFIGVGGYGVSVARADIPAIAAVVAAVVAALLVLLIALGISRRRRGAPATAAPSAGGPAAGEGGTAARSAALSAASPDDPIEAEFLAVLARTPSSKRALMGLAAHYAERKNVQGFDEIAQRIYRLSGGRGPNWVHVASVGRQLDPDNPLFALPAGEADETVVTEESETGAPAIDAAAVAEPPAPAEVQEIAPVPAPTEAGTEPERPVRAEPPVASEPAAETPPSTGTPVAAHTSPEQEPGVVAEVVPPEAGETPAYEPEASETPPSAESERAMAPEREATLPPEAIAALDGLEMGLPPRADAEPGGDTAHPPQADEHDYEQAHEHEGEAPASQAGSNVHDEATPPVEPGRSVGQGAHERDGQPGQESPPAPAAPAVSGLGAAPIGPLALSFDLDLPGGEAGERTGASASAESTPTPQFTPEQLARIARNKLDLAGEYIALGDLGGARTLIHEVIESNDAATRDEAQALLATLAPLS